MKKKLLTTLSVVLIIGLAALGILAYLTDTDSDVNVMTLGNVDIEQIEQEWNADGTELVQFNQNKPLYPYVGELGWDKNKDDAYRTFTMNNVVDKYVSVKNTGESDAYVRTVFAFEMGEYESINDFYYKVIGTSTNAVDGTEFKFNGTWDWGDKYVTKIDGKNYMIWEAVHEGPLAVGSTTIPSLLQVYMNKDCGNEEVKKVDGNGNGTYDILVLSQAVQAEGFDSAAAALTAGFGEANEANVKAWFGGMSIPPEVATVDELKAALAAGGTIVLKNDITADGTASLEVPAGVTATLDLNEKTLTNAVSGAPALVNKGTLTIKGEGAIVNGISDTAKSHTVRNYGTMTIEDGTFGTFATSGAAVVNDGTTTINGGTFASRQESNAQYGQGPAAYAFINNAGTMTINDATLDGPTHGIFGAYAGKLIVNGGKYTLVGNNGMGCYVVYATGDGTKVSLNGGTINTNEPRHGRVFFVYDNGNYFNVDAVKKGKIEVNGARIYLNGVEQTY